MGGSMMNIPIPAIAPSILTADFGRLRDQVQEAADGGVDLIHLDVMDGHFVPNITFGPVVVSAVRQATSLPMDVHLMIDNPDRYIDAFADAGADFMTIHVETTPHVHRVLQQIKSRGVGAGVAINPGTSVEDVEPVFPYIDLVLVMSVNPGFGGQSFIPESLARVRHLRSVLAEHGASHVRIEIDGGINSETISDAFAAGAEIFVAGSAVFNDREPVSKAVRGLRSSLESARA